MRALRVSLAGAPPAVTAPRLFLWVIALLGPSFLRAELKWAVTERREDFAAGLDHLVADYAFTNAGPEAVTLLELRPDCECVSVSSDRDVYEPGAHGVVRITFAPGESTGRQRKAAFVVTSLHPDRPVMLRLETVVPAVVTIEPAVLLWDETNPSAPRSFAVVLDPAVRASIRSVETDSPFVHLTLRPAQLPDRYSLVPAIEPGAKDGGVQVLVKAQVGGRIIRRSATLIVRRP